MQMLFNYSSKQMFNNKQQANIPKLKLAEIRSLSSCTAAYFQLIVILDIYLPRLCLVQKLIKCSIFSFYGSMLHWGWLGRRERFSFLFVLITYALT